MLVAKNHHFEKDGKRFFYLADTCWSAFTNITMDEWTYYLDKRKAQGFNVIQINVLRQWDASESDLDILPFPVTYHEDGRFDYDYQIINEAYFDRAEAMLEEVVKRDMVPGLVLLWANYVPGTWAGNYAPNNHFDYDQLAKYTEYVVKHFSKFKPIYFISGDTDFPTSETIAYYRRVFETAKKFDPEALYSFHIKGRFTDLPQEFLEQVDFFSYQSGHNYSGQYTAYDIPQQMRQQGYQGPIVNTEPCYDQISYSRNEYGRYTPYDVRKASWQSVLAGADAGLTYGAHGIWSWHKEGKKFGIVEGEGFDYPFDWRDAIKFRGADDVGFLKEIILQDAKKEVEPINVVLNKREAIKVARLGDKYLVYVPVNTQVNLQPLGLSADNSHFKVIDLQTRKFKQGLWDRRNPNKIALPACMKDFLLVIEVD